MPSCPAFGIIVNTPAYIPTQPIFPQTFSCFYLMLNPVLEWEGSNIIRLALSGLERGGVRGRVRLDKRLYPFLVVLAVEEERLG